MVEQRSVLEQLNENPVTETSPWIVGEPSLQDVLGDPVVHAVLRRDGLSTQDLMRAIVRGRSRLSPARPSPARPVANAPVPLAPTLAPPPVAVRASDAA